MIRTGEHGPSGQAELPLCGGEESWWDLPQVQREAVETHFCEQFRCLLLSNESHPNYSKASYLLQTSRLSQETCWLLFASWHQIWFCMIEIKSALALLQWVLFVRAVHLVLWSMFHISRFTWQCRGRPRNSSDGNLSSVKTHVMGREMH